mmetsp:Transcript_166884/g.535696  ORF Transcript_166884/g.535696 Transcript_166884/m.535696 type:complete len:382 (-) Transcript_166884:426-1571(-)
MELSTAFSVGRTPPCEPPAIVARVVVKPSAPAAVPTFGTTADCPTILAALAMMHCTRTSRRRRVRGLCMSRIRLSVGSDNLPDGNLGGLIDGKAIAADVRQEVAEQVKQLSAERGVTPGLAVVLVGDRPDSAVYVRNKTVAAKEVGISILDYSFPATVSEAELLKCIEELNGNSAIHGILVQLPLPVGFDERIVLAAIDVRKDVDGLSTLNLGSLAKPGDSPLAVPCTPAGCMELLRRSGVDVAGKECVVLGRSGIVGMPMALLLLEANATVTMCHSRTQDIASVCKRADIVVAAVGKPRFVKGDWLKLGCVVLDVGINRVEDTTRKSGYRLVGDVDFESARGKASLITPVPGGVGPMTIAMLLHNTVRLANAASSVKQRS